MMAIPLAMLPHLAVAVMNQEFKDEFKDGDPYLENWQKAVLWVRKQ